MKRIQRSRKKGWTLPENTICVDRTSRYGNPFRVGHAFDEKSIRILSLVASVNLRSLIELIKDDVVRQRAFDCYRYGTALTVDIAVAMFRAYMEMVKKVSLEDYQEFLLPLKGKNVACFCKEHDLCHGDVLIELASEL